MAVLNNYVFAVLVLFLKSALGESDSDSVSELHEASFHKPNYGSQRYCTPNTVCVHISKCLVLQNIVNHQCVYSDRVSTLGCGYVGSGMVCCPKYGENRPIFNENRERCGLPAVRGPNYIGLGAFPFVARIGFKNVATSEVRYPCSGSIINSRTILTTANCAVSRFANFKLYNARFGEYVSNAGIDCNDEFCALPVQDIAINHVVVHPGYQPNIYKDNIAILIMSGRVNFTVTIQPICLPTTWSNSNNYGLLVGWGKLAGQTAAPSYQQALELPIVSLQKCFNVYGRDLPITEYQLCVGGERGRDACAGFSGSPLLTKESGTYFQIGMLSFGSDQCGAPGVPSVYVNIKRYVNWIRDNTPVYYTN